MKKLSEKNTKIIAFTIIESIFMIAALIILSFVLGGLYVKSAKLSGPESPAPPAEVSAETPSL